MLVCGFGQCCAWLLVYGYVYVYACRLREIGDFCHANGIALIATGSYGQ